MMLISSEDIPYGLKCAINRYMDLPSMTVVITWLLVNPFTIIILDMGSAPHVEYFDVVPCGAFVDINNYPMGGLATISNSMSLSKSLSCKQPRQIKPIWNGFHLIVLMIGRMKNMDTLMVYLLLVGLN